MPFLPEVQAPNRAIPLNEKMFWTALVLLLFFVMYHIVPFGGEVIGGSFVEFIQTVLASKTGTLLTIGIGPIILASIFLQLFAGAKLIEFNPQDPVDKRRFTATQKVLAIALAIIETMLFVLPGVYIGPDPNFGDAGLAMGLIIAQIAFTSILLIFLDEVVSKYGVGSGISLFIAAGVLFLKLPRATYDGISWIDALFISTSAVCVTGLTPLNILATFTPVGQAVILILFQIGGLGIVTLTSFIALLFQQKGSFRLQDQAVLMEILDDSNLSKLGEMLRAIVRVTLIFESIGALFLWLRWRNLGFSTGEGIFKAVFHSVSAYCNAGFSNLQNGLETVGYNRDPVTMLTIMALIILGGLGFYTMRELLYNRRYSPDRKRHYSLQTRMILIISGSLIVLGAAVIALVQWKDWAGMPAWLRVMNAFFTSVTSRTAGFSTINVGALSLPSIILIMLLMYIGASPNSTGGGIKVTTFGMLIAASWAFIRGRDRVEIGWRTIPIATIRRSYIVLLGSLGLIFIAMLLLSIAETAAFEDLLFEVVSAFGTVGLSRGVTPLLSGFSKIVITIVMFMGRVGLYTLAIAVGRESVVQHNYTFPETNVMVG